MPSRPDLSHPFGGEDDGVVSYDGATLREFAVDRFDPLFASILARERVNGPVALCGVESVIADAGWSLDALAAVSRPALLARSAVQYVGDAVRIALPVRISRGAVRTELSIGPERGSSGPAGRVDTPAFGAVGGPQCVHPLARRAHVQRAAAYCWGPAHRPLGLELSFKCT